MAIDPVCNMEVDEKKTKHKSTYHNHDYYFCSAECKSDFDRNPAEYAASATAFESGGRAGEKISEKAGEMASAASEKTGEFAGKARMKITSAFSTRKGDYADKMRSLSAALHDTSRTLHEQNQGAFGKYADAAAEKVERFAAYLHEKDAEQIINEFENYVTRRPGLFIAGALAGGFLAARYLKSSRGAEQQVG